MAINPDIRDSAYQFFIEEAPELLQSIEAGLLTLRQERNTAKVHNIMRSAHSLKGGAASVELEAIKTLAHRLENIVKALYNETIEIDTDLESQLLQAYDCLRLPLMEQIATGSFDAEEALALAEPIFAQIEERLGDALTQADNYIPSSSELGVDMALSIFEVDVQEGLEHLAHVVAHPSDYEVAGELRAQAEVFAGFAELLNQPGFGAIAKTTLAALDAHPNRTLVIAQLALTDFQMGRQAVLAAAVQDASARGAITQAIGPCPGLVALANSTRESPQLTVLTPESGRKKASHSGQKVDSVSKAKPTPAIDNSRTEENITTCVNPPNSSKESYSGGSIHNKAQAEEVRLNVIPAGEFIADTESIEDTEDSLVEDVFDRIFGDLDMDMEASSAAAEVREDTPTPAEDSELGEDFSATAKQVDTFFSTFKVPDDTQSPAEDSELEEDFSAAAEQMDAFFAAFEELEDTPTPEEDWELEEDFSTTEVSEDTLTATSDRALEEIFTTTPELLEELTAAAEVSENTQNATQDGALEEIVSVAPENLEELRTAAEVPENIQTAAQPETLEEIFSIPLEEVFGGTVSTSDADADNAASSPVAIDVEAFADATLPNPSLVQRVWSKLVDGDREDRGDGKVFSSPPSPPKLIPTTDDRTLAQGGTLAVSEEAAQEAPSLQEDFKSTVATPEAEAEKELQDSQLKVETSNLQPPNLQLLTPETLEQAVQSIGEIFEELPPLQGLPLPTAPSNLATSTATNLSAASQSGGLVPASPIPEKILPVDQAASPTSRRSKQPKPVSTDSRKGQTSPTPNLTVRVDSERLERMNNVVGELAINRNGLSLQNEQLQRSVRELLNRFVRVQNVVGNLQELSYQMLVIPERPNSDTAPRLAGQLGDVAARQADFDALELDRYGVLSSRLQGLLEDMVQLEESVDDIVLFARATDQTLGQQRQMLTQLRDELIWARMLPLGEVLNRFPRVLRDLSTRYHKPVNVKLSGTSVLVDKAVLEKLNDPLLHLLRNAFDHGIESPQERRQKGKPEQGEVEVKAYHQGNHTIIEVRDDGQGLNSERIRDKALELGLLTEEQLAMTTNSHLHELIFEPGFSTAKQVSELSGRGVGLDVVRGQMRSLKGTINVTSSPGVGTTFTLRLPLTLTIAKLLVCFVGPTALAMPSDGVEEIVVPKAIQVKESGRERFLEWRGQIVPVYRLAELLEYNCSLPDSSPSKALIAVPSPQDWALPMLVIRRDQYVLALEIDRLVTEQELVIKPFGSAIAPPSFTYGCTILGDGSLIPVIDGAVLVDRLMGNRTGKTSPSNLPGAIVVAQHPSLGEDAPQAKPLSQQSIPNTNASVSKTTPSIRTIKAPTVLVVDDAAALRRTLALTLERSGCQVLQARDGREAIDQLQHSPSVKLVICDIEMPNMNGFEFLSYRRQEPDISKIPVAMLTSRSNDKHRWLAMHLGATAYFTKPYLEQEFVAAIKEIIGKSTAESQPALQPTH